MKIRDTADYLQFQGLDDALKNDASERIVWLRLDHINYQSIIKHCGGEDAYLPKLTKTGN